MPSSYHEKKPVPPFKFYIGQDVYYDQRGVNCRVARAAYLDTIRGQAIEYDLTVVGDGSGPMASLIEVDEYFLTPGHRSLG